MVDLKSKPFDISQNFNISLDGPAASGKGTIALILAKKFSLKYFPSSIVYRQLAFDCISQKIDVSDIDAVITFSKALKLDNSFDLDNENIGNIASQIAVISEIRNILYKYLINLVKTTPGMVMEGRNMGTVVAPDADIRFLEPEILKLGLKDDISICKQKKKHVYSVRFYGK